MAEGKGVTKMAEEKQATEKLPAQITAEMLAKEDSVFLNVARFEHAQRVARVLAESTMVPDHFQKNVGNCLIALNLAQRMQLDVFMLMQSIYVVHGRPGIEGKLAIALVEGYGRFGPLEYKFEGTGKTDKGVERPNKCTAYAKDLKTRQIIEGPPVTWEMAIAEGWTKGKAYRDGSGEMPSKWQTLPQLMFMYRSASFFARVHCPGALLGLRTIEEIEDIGEIDITPKRPSADNGGKEEARQKAIEKFKSSIPAPFVFEHPNLQQFLFKLAQANRCQIEEVMVEASEKAGEFWQGYEEWLKENQSPEAGPPSQEPKPTNEDQTPEGGPPPFPNHAQADAEIERQEREKKNRKGPKRQMNTCPKDGKFPGKEIAVVFCESTCVRRDCRFAKKEREPGQNDE
jgi:hypothetical protein